MQFQVKVLRADTGIATMLLDAVDAGDATRQAAAAGHAVLAVSRAPLGARTPGSSAGRFPLVLFSQELLSLLASGIAVVESIQTLEEKEPRPHVRRLLQGLLVGMREGRPLSSTLEDWPLEFPPLYVASMRASERTSDLQGALGRYIAYATQLETLRSRLVSAAIYPVLLVAVTLLVVLFLLGYVVPRFSHIYADMGGDLPLMSRLLMEWGLFLENGWPLLAGLAGLAVAVLLGGGARWIGARMLRTLWRVPALGERMRVFQLARLYRTLGMLLRGGIAIVPALEMVKGLLSEGLRPHLVAATTMVRDGRTISQGMELNGLTTPVSLRMLRVGERAGNMGDMMERAAAFHDEEMARWAEWATRLVGPVLMLVMGLLIGGIVVLMYLPIFQLAESIR